jgi:hypothetical protein
LFKRTIYSDAFPQHASHLPFVLKGAWQIGKGLQAVYRKLWNTMNGAGWLPTHLRKSFAPGFRDPGGRKMELRTSALGLLWFSSSQKESNVPKGMQNRVEKKQR